MSGSHEIRNIRKKINNSALSNSVIQHQIEKRIRTTGNINLNAVPFTSTSASSSTKLSVRSIAEGKSVVSSVSLSLERKNLIQYMPRNIGSCLIPVGQNTVVHLDNYSHFMAQRVTTTKAAFKKTEITTSASNSRVDVDLKFILGGVNSLYDSNSRTLEMNKQKLLDLSAAAPAKKRGRKKSPRKSKMIDIKTEKNNSAQLKPIVKKTKRTRHKKVVKPRPTRKTKVKAKAGSGTANNNINDETSEKELQKLHFLPSNAQTKILRPCIYTQQSKKCLSEISCRYLHSDFPCKYYYLNLPCPQDVKCQFMHNGPLEPKLMEALKSHILELLSTKPTAVETYFVKQMCNIEDLSRRLLSFQNFQGQNCKVIEVMDEGDEEDQVLKEENSNRSSDNNFNDTMTTNSLSNAAPETTMSNKLDMVYENLKETNSKISEMDKKLKNLKNSSNMTTNEKIVELHNIYETLKEEEKRLPICVNTISTVYDVNESITSSSNLQNEQQESPLVLVYPDNAETVIDAEHEYSETTNLNMPPQLVANDIFSSEELAQQSIGSDILINEELTIGGNNEISFSNGGEICDFDKSSNMNSVYEEELPQNIITILDNSSLTIEGNEKLPETNDEIIIENNTINNSQIENKRFEYEDENLGKTNSPVYGESKNIDEYKELDNSLCLPNECLPNEMQLANDEKEVIESKIKDVKYKEKHVEEESPLYEEIVTTTPLKINRIRLRSHILQDTDESTNNINNEQLIATSSQPTKPIRNRRLRLPKPSQKTTQECHNKGTTCFQDAKDPPTQKVILTKRFLKKAKAKLEQQQQSLVNETHSITTDGNNDVIATSVVDQDLLPRLHNTDPNRNHSNIENVDDVFVSTQVSDGSNPLSLSQNPLIIDSDCDNEEDDNIKDTNKDTKRSLSASKSSKLPPMDIEKSENENNSKLKRRIYFEKNTSSPDSSSPFAGIKEKFNLGNPHVVLPKLKTPFCLPSTQEDVQADSTATISNVNPIVASSTLSAGDDISTQQKRRRSTTEYDLNTSLNENKYLRIGNSKSSIRKVNSKIDSKDCDIDNESSDEKLVIGDDAVLRTSSSYRNEQQPEVSEPSSAHVVTHHQQQHHSHSQQQEQNVQQENKSDLRQQIKDMRKKKDLLLQVEQQRFQQQKEETEGTSINTVTTSGKNIQQEKILMEIKESAKPYNKQYEKNEGNKKEQEQITIASNSFDSIENNDDVEPGELTPSPPESNKYSNETTLTEKINIEYSSYSSLFNKLSTHTKKHPINFENFSVNITPIASPTYGDNTIASPSPVKETNDYRMVGEIDGCVTYPPMKYRLYEIELGKIYLNKPTNIDKLKKTTQLDPRIFRTLAKKQLMPFCKPVESTSNSLVPVTTSFFAQATTNSMISQYDPRNRTPSIMADMATKASFLSSNQTALTPYNSLQTVAISSPAPSPSSSSFMNATNIPNAVPLALQYHDTAQPIIQPQIQQTPNMFLYGCLQRSPWYQSLMSTLKIQINQSISQLVCALNNYHRERLLMPEMVFDIFKIDCAGELLEIMRNLGIFVDANGIINEQRHIPTFGGRSTCCSAAPVNATYSFIQQVLTPNDTHYSALTTHSSPNCNGTPLAADGQLNIHEPFVSCYVKAHEPQVQKHSDDSVTTHDSQRECKQCTHQDDNNNNRNYNNNHRNDNNSNYNNHNNNRRYNNSNHFKKPYDNNNGNNSYQQRSGQRSNNYSNNPRFMKPGAGSPPTNKSNSPPPSNFSKNNFDGATGGRGGGGRFNNNRRFNNYNNNNSGSSWSSSSDNKYQNNNSPPRTSSPSSLKKSSSPPPVANKSNDEEECWD